jgi:hypothetical protein
MQAGVWQAFAAMHLALFGGWCLLSGWRVIWGLLLLAHSAQAVTSMTSLPGRGRGHLGY